MTSSITKGRSKYENAITMFEKSAKQTLRLAPAAIRAIVILHDDELWKPDHESWEAYCEKMWGWNTRSARQRLTHAKVVSRLGKAMPALEQERMPNIPQALKLADMPEEAMVEEWRETAREIVVSKAQPLPRGKDTKQRKRGGPAVDDLGRPLKNMRVIRAFNQRKHLASAMSRLRQLRELFNGIAGIQVGKWMTPQQIDADLANLQAAIKFSTPYTTCPLCKGEGCRSCRQSGWMPKEPYDRLPEEDQWH